MANLLASESSPYLLQHADNPVDWHPWGAEAFRLARELQRPVLLSIGYSACHWCHVMARESFSDPGVAAFMNANFVNVKVDREERPDVDAIYMAALQALTGSGGWPLTALLTPAGEPFFAGTYWPPEPRHGLPAFRDILQAVTRAWNDNGAEVTATAAELSRHLQQQVTAGLRRGALGKELPAQAVAGLLDQLDGANGGFGGAPKFPPHSVLRFLLARPEPEARDAALLTLRKMATGGIFDQLGGGLSRYTVDAGWLVPHFEKMLFDSAQFLGLTAVAFTLSRDSGFLQAAQLSADWLLSDIRAADGTFMAARSAESEGKEGEFYLWEHADFMAALGDGQLAAYAAAAYGVTEAGNFEGRNILTLSPAAWATPGDPRLEAARGRLLATRQRRPQPDLDDKILTSWNGLVIENLALAGRLLGDPRLVTAAAEAAGVFLGPLASGELRHTASVNTPLLLEDLAFLGNGLLGLYQATLDPRYLQAASTAAERIVSDYSEGGGLYSTAGTGEALLLRPRELADSGAPADTAEAARLLLRLGRLREDSGMLQLAEATLQTAAANAASQPTLLGSSLAASDELLAPALEVVLFGNREDAALKALAAEIGTRHLPHALLLHESAGSDYAGLLQGRSALNGEPTAYLCLDRACRLPVQDPGALASQLPGHT